MNHTATQTRRLWAEIPWRSAKINPTLRKYVYMRLSLKSKRPRLPFLPRSLHVKHEALQTHASGSHPSFSPHQLIIKRSGTDTPTPSAEASPAVGSCVWDPALNLVPSVYAHTKDPGFSQPSQTTHSHTEDRAVPWTNRLFPARFLTWCNRPSLSTTLETAHRLLRPFLSSFFLLIKASLIRADSSSSGGIRKLKYFNTSLKRWQKPSYC